MATGAQWAVGYARQADADLRTFDLLQTLPRPACHKLQFLQMACEKLAKAYLCGRGTDPATLQQSHAYVAGTLPVILREQTEIVNLPRSTARNLLHHIKLLAQEIDFLAPAVRHGSRPDNCEYPWEDGLGRLHVLLDWTFQPSQLLLVPTGRSALKLIRQSINRMLA